MDAKKTEIELRPNKMLHRALEAADRMEKKRVGTADAPRQFEKEPRQSTLKFGDDRLGYASQTAWTWSALAIEDFPPDDLEAEKAYIENA